MYRYFRNTHLLLGLFSLPFLMMYGVSAVQMAHTSWFNLKPRPAEINVSLAPGKAPRDAARELMHAHGICGELAQVKNSPAAILFRIQRTGTAYDVRYNPATGKAMIRESRLPFMGMLNRIHHIGGLWHGFAAVNVWAALVGVISVFLLAIGVTGIYLWFKLYRERVIGSILLVLSAGFGVSLIAMIRMA